MSTIQLPSAIPTVVYVVEWKDKEGQDKSLWFFSGARAVAWAKISKIGDFNITQWRQGSDFNDPDNKKSFFKGFPSL